MRGREIVILALKPQTLPKVVSAIRGELFSPNLPTSSAVQVAGLVLPGAMIEIEAIAVLD